MTDTPAPSQPPQMLITYHNGLYYVDASDTESERFVSSTGLLKELADWMLEVEAAQ
jgi:hypothetical protein